MTMFDTAITALKRHKLAPFLVQFGVIVLTLVITALIYWQGLSGPYLLDDFANITSQYISDFVLDDILYSLTHNNSGNLGRPVSMLSFLFTGIVHGQGTWGYKYHNLMMHLLNGLLIFWLLIKLLPHLSEKKDFSKVIQIAGVTTVFWLLHPLQVSTVLYVVQRMAQLSTFFILVSLLTYVIAREQSRNGNWRFYLLAYLVFPLSMLLAVFSKENGVLIPVYLLMIEYIVFGLKFGSPQQKHKILIFNSIFGVIPIILGSIVLLLSLDSLLNYSFRNFNMIERLMTQLHVVAFYIKLILLPAISDMSLFHDDWQPVREPGFVTILLFFVFIAALASIFICRKRYPVISFGIAWFVISHLLESTFFSLELVFEHRNYLALMGVVLIPVYYLSTVDLRGYRHYLAATVLALTVFMTSNRVTEWKDESTFYSVSIIEHPESKRVHTAYANLLFRNGQYQEGFEQLDIITQMDTTDYGVLLLQIIVLCETDVYTHEMFGPVFERAEKYPVTIGGLFALNNLYLSISQGKCKNIPLGQVIGVIQAAMQLSENKNTDVIMGQLHLLKARFSYLIGEDQTGYENMVTAFEYSRESDIVIEVFDVELGRENYDRAEELIAILEDYNQQSFKYETGRIREMKAKLNSVRERLSVEQ